MNTLHRFQVVALTALLAAIASPTCGETTIVLDGNDTGRVFEGVGAVSAGASTRLLYDYEEPYRGDVLDFLFAPKFGAGFQHLKVEIGGGENSTCGSEPSHAVTRDELAHPTQFDNVAIEPVSTPLRATIQPGLTILPALATTSGPLPADAHPLAAKINRFLADQRKVADFQPTGLARQDYLKVVDGQVNAMRKYQDAEGRIIDPVKKAEYYFTTPCYAHAVATLVASGYRSDPALVESGAKAMDVATADMAAGCPATQGHGDFYTYPVMLALEQFEKTAPAERIQRWRKQLAAVVPSKTYNAYGRAEGNWTLVHTAGEFFRALEGMTDLAYVERALDIQRPNLTPLGMYLERGAPFPYDAFSRYFLTGMLHRGYCGAHDEFYRDRMWRGAWTSLLIQSPFGELPTGYRSSQHIWNEAELAKVYEVYAAYYAKAGRIAEAGAFKRGAHLALRCIQQWIRPDGSGYIVKNRYPIEAEHGYERYSVHTCYNMLACSMLSAAWSYADDTIAERPAPADLGGFVIPIPEFHTIVAHAGGAYIQYKTQGDHHYDPTGLIRIHLRGGHPQLGPSAGVGEKLFPEGAPAMAVGPAWQDATGTWQSLAATSPEEPKVEILSESAVKAAFRVVYDKLSGVRVAEIITLADGTATIEDQIAGDGVKGLRVYYPALVFDGRNKTDLRLDGAEATLQLGSAGVRFRIEQPQAITLRRLGQPWKHRNGLVEPLYAEVAGPRVTYSIRGLQASDLR